MLSGITAFGVLRFAEDEARRTAEKVGRQIASAVLVPLSKRHLGQPGEFVRDDLLADLAPFLSSGMIERVKVFTVDGGTARIVFSDEQRIEGHTGSLRPELAARLDRDEVVVQEVPDDPEHTYERSLPGDRFEVYFGFRDAGGTPTRLEVYVPVAVGETTRYAVAELVPLVLTGLVLVALATVPLSIALARRMERDRAEQRAVRDYGLAAAELARRDLAQRLHDGVIPDLAGASLLLEAIRAEGLRTGGEAPWELIGRAQGLVAADVRRLRGLLDELVPACSVADDLGGALRDLVDQLDSSSSAGARGVPTVTIEVPEGLRPSEAAAVLVHRIAGELLRNAVRHAGAGSVRIRIASGDKGSIELTVADDGSGFDPSRARRHGHIGLQLVQQVARDSAGTLEIDSRPGLGTVVRVTIPQNPRPWSAESTSAVASSTTAGRSPGSRSLSRRHLSPTRLRDRAR
ncbi:sensor histidine kinase [Pseudonocardia yunnanensis]|uniref:sensor histidine kinase n=1 Tax=Pseudonocardia yunnanensis TaxID=58107 RepID=UPI0036D4084B